MELSIYNYELKATEQSHTIHAFGIATGTEAFHIASILGDRGTLFGFGVTPATAQGLSDKTFKLKLNSIHAQMLMLLLLLLPVYSLIETFSKGVSAHAFLSTFPPDIRFIQEPFARVASPSETLLANVSLIVCLPPSSLSAVSDPVDFLLQEGGIYIIIASTCINHSSGCMV